MTGFELIIIVAGMGITTLIMPWSAALLLYFASTSSRRYYVAALYGVLFGCVVALLFGSPALAAEVATAGDKAVVLPWGDWLIAILNIVVPLAVAALVGQIMIYVVPKVVTVFPWLKDWLTQDRVETLVRNVTAYGLNAVGGAAKGQTLTVGLGSAVIATAVRRAVEVAEPKVLEAAGGPQGLAAKVFRTLDLEPAANKANTLDPVVDNIPATMAAKP